jgi:sirohydrochlorin ferrochelatase
VALFAVLADCSTSTVARGVGVLVIAHGDYGTEWNQLVRNALAPLDDQYLFEIGFLLAPPNGSLQDALDRLEARGAEMIVAVPLLISSHSEHYDELAYYLRQRDSRPETAEHEPVDYTADLVLTSGIDYEPGIADALLRFATEVSDNPATETVILIGHGPNAEEYNHRWMENLNRIKAELVEIGRFRKVQSLTLRDDAELEVQMEAMRQIRRAVEEADRAGTALVIPLMIATGSVHDGIRQKLDGLTYRMSESGLVAEPGFLPTWVEQTVSIAVAALE